MRERPILFNGAMVRAILGGKKTQTRRAVKGTALDWLGKAQFTPEYVASPGNDLCPFGQPGDRLWVRETTQIDRTTSDSAELARYCADQEPVCYPIGTGNGYDGAWQLWWYSRDTCPKIHMPRSACRLELEITGVRVERLQSISRADSLAEGIHSYPHHWRDCEYPLPDVAYEPVPGSEHRYSSPVAAFRALWIDTGGDWDSNPWVWVIEFNRIREVSHG